MSTILKALKRLEEESTDPQRDLRDQVVAPSATNAASRNWPRLVGVVVAVAAIAGLAGAGLSWFAFSDGGESGNLVVADEMPATVQLGAVAAEPPPLGDGAAVASAPDREREAGSAKAQTPIVVAQVPRQSAQEIQRPVDPAPWDADPAPVVAAPPAPQTSRGTAAQGSQGHRRAAARAAADSVESAANPQASESPEPSSSRSDRPDSVVGVGASRLPVVEEPPASDREGILISELEEAKPAPPPAPKTEPKPAPPKAAAREPVAPRPAATESTSVARESKPARGESAKAAPSVSGEALAAKAPAAEPSAANAANSTNTESLGVRAAPPALYVVRTRWHPAAERRTAQLELADERQIVSVREGDSIGSLVVSEITLSSVVFLHDGETLTRRVGEKLSVK